jgi:hypothetical protein
METFQIHVFFTLLLCYNAFYTYALDINYIRNTNKTPISRDSITYFPDTQHPECNKISPEQLEQFQKITNNIRHITKKEKVNSKIICQIKKIGIEIKNKLQNSLEKSFYIHPNKDIQYPIQIFKSGKIIIHLESDDPNKKKGGYKKFYRSINIITNTIKATLEIPINNQHSLEKIISELKIMDSLRGLKHNSSYSDFDIINKQQGEKITKILIINTDLYDGDLKWYSPQVKDIKTMIDIMQKATKAVHELHKKKIIHQDIKPQNFLIKKQKNTTLLALTDYGLSKHHSDKTFGKHICGTKGYIDPQVCLLKIKSNISYENFKEAVAADIFSLGMTFYKTFFQDTDLQKTTKDINYLAFPNKNEEKTTVKQIKDKIDTFKRLYKDKKTENNKNNQTLNKIKKIILKMMTTKTQDRPSTNKIIKQVNKLQQELIY